MPPAARRPEPPLPDANGWPFSEGFSQTSGAGRTVAHAFLWTDFLYDDNGATTGPATGESAGAYPFGTYQYPNENQAGNGADIFRAGVAADGGATWWRVDWNTLVNRRVPAAAFALDLDDSGGAAAPWGGNVGLRSAGVDTTLVLTSAGAFLDGERVADTTVDMAARSFVAKLPTAVLDVAERSSVWLAAGLADAEGDSFQSLGPEHQHLPGQPNVFNVAFRDYGDEPRSNNFWFEQTQATTLTAPAADVSAFRRRVDWNELRRGETRERQPRLRGWINRWYVSSVELGQGRVKDFEGNVDRAPNYLGRVQPYAIYVPEDDHFPATQQPLTWLLHSLTINHNQYSATMPDLTWLACEQRESLCVTTLGRGPDGYYRDEAELDFWEVWADVARSYKLHRNRTVIGGYSMGGFGAFNMGLDHPDLFAAMVILASAANEDIPRLENARWLPYYHGHGMLDELVPYTEEALPTIDELDRLGYRYRFDSYPTKDHVAWSLEDDNVEAAEWLAQRIRRRNLEPGQINYEWFPKEARGRLGIGSRGAWWVRGLRARDRSADSARVRAVSHAQPVRPFEPVRSEKATVDDKGSPIERRQLRWKRGPLPERRQRATVRLTNVGTAALRLVDASLDAWDRRVVTVHTDGATTLRLRQLYGSRVRLNGEPATRVMELGAGRHRVVLRPPVIEEIPPWPPCDGGPNTACPT